LPSLRKFRVLAACLAAGIAASSGCYRLRNAIFDGVPPPKSERTAGAAGGAPGSPSAPLTIREHGPYAAKLCDACHDAAATNALVAPPEQLCFRCHALPLDKAYVHGPLASGGCLVCHDPHSSPNRSLLVSSSEDFCFHCHDRATVEAISAHADRMDECTVCHDAHMSDRPHLLK